MCTCAETESNQKRVAQLLNSYQRLMEGEISVCITKADFWAHT